MRKRKRIALAYDFSEPSRVALAHAVGLAKEMSAELVLVHVMPPSLSTDARRGAFNNLRDELAPFRSDVNGRVRLEEGDPASRIAAALARESPDLAVIGTHARVGLERAMLGSVAEELIRATPTPLLIVRGGIARSFRRIVVGTDFSPASFEARRVAEQIARALAAEIRLVHVLPTSTDDDERNRAVSRLEGAATGMRARGIPTVPVVTWGEPAAALVAETEGDPGTIIAVGTRDRAAVTRWLLGSVASSVFKRAPGAVLIAHSPEERVAEESFFPELAFTD